MVNVSTWAVPTFATAMLGTFTYPRAVRLARSPRLLGLKNFYAIHFAIAPFLALIHLNFFSLLYGYFLINKIEYHWR